ncbi:Fe-S-containing hydro-lyase [bacterium]|nr:Fe-S-containing hydro-lyase [bacterium]
MAALEITIPLDLETVKSLHSGDAVEITGTIYTARDAAHKRICEMLDRGENPPFELKGNIIYYVGPTPPKPGQPIGSAGPTTSFRMDAYSPRLIKLGLRGMIGKGGRSDEVKAACREHGCIYFGALGGGAALLSKRIKAAEIIAFEDLGAEAVRKLTVERFPVFVINDVYGGDAYLDGAKKYEEM